MQDCHALFRNANFKFKMIKRYISYWLESLEKVFSKLNGLNKMATCSKSIASEYCRTDPMSNSRWRMCVESDPETSTRTRILHEFFRAHRFKILHTSSEYDRILFIWIHRGMKITFVSTIFFWNSITFNN